MRYRVDNDLHIHTYISPCAGHDMRWTPAAILAYGIASDYKLLCITDHLWDKKVPTPCHNWAADFGLDLEKGREVLPLPQSDRCKLLFGIEADIDYMGNIAVSKEEMDHFDFIIFSPSHMHMTYWQIDPTKLGESAPERKQCYMDRLNYLLSLDLPFEKCGLAHFTTGLVCKQDPVGVFRLFSDEDYRSIFGKVAQVGMGVELNFYGDWHNRPAEEDRAELLRPYRIAKEMGCKFYFGTDAHITEEIAGRRAFFEQVVDLLGLEESDKFPLIHKMIDRN